MKTAIHTLKVQTGGYGLFAQVVLTATAADRFLKIDFNADDYWRTWLRPIEFGINYGYEQIQHELWKRKEGVHISVDEVMATYVDTTEMAMAFVAAMAFFDAVEISPSVLPTFDREKRLVSLPV